MKKLAILFLFTFAAIAGFSQSNTLIEDQLNSLTPAELNQLILDGEVPTAVGILHEAFTENPNPLAAAVMADVEIKEILISYAASTEPVDRDNLESKLLAEFY